MRQGYTPIQQRRSEDRGDVWASRSLEGYSRRLRERELWVTPSEIGQKTCGKPEGLRYGTCRRGHVWDEGLHAQKRGWARCVTWIAGRRWWSRYKESPRRRNVRDGGCEDDGVGLPRRALRAVAVPGEFLCNKKADYEPNLKLCRVIQQQIHETRDISLPE